MRFEIYCEEKSIPRPHMAAIDEFTKRLSAYCSVTLHPERPSCTDLHPDKPSHLIVTVTRGPSTCSSEELAQTLRTITLHGISVVHVIIDTANRTSVPDGTTSAHTLSVSALSLSDATACLLFYEQLYRAYTILQGKTYHK